MMRREDVDTHLEAAMDDDGQKRMILEARAARKLPQTVGERCATVLAYQTAP